MKSNAIKNLARNVAKAADRTLFILLIWSASSEMNIPNESDNESATAMVRIPQTINNFVAPARLSPMMSPMVVMMPDVMPKAIHVLTDFFSVMAGLFIAFWGW